jgi:hypothetical protein
LRLELGRSAREPGDRRVFAVAWRLLFADARMSTTPYRTPPPAPLPSCDRCGDAILHRSALHGGKRGEPVCHACFIGQYDVLALFGVGALTAGALTSCGPLFMSGILIPILGAYAIYRGGI